jgi:hypothetical protein
MSGKLPGGRYTTRPFSEVSGCQSGLITVSFHRGGNETPARGTQPCRIHVDGIVQD